MKKLLGQRFDLDAQPVIWLDLERTMKDEFPVMTTVLRAELLTTCMHDQSMLPAPRAKRLPFEEWESFYRKLAE